MKQAKKYKRKFIHWPVVGKMEMVSVTCNKGGKLCVYRGRTQINIDSEPAKKILRFFGNMPKLIEGTDGGMIAVMPLERFT